LSWGFESTVILKARDEYKTLDAREEVVILKSRIEYNDRFMMAPSLLAQTTYAELVERCANAAFSDAFREDGAFTAKTIKGHRYWYFQAGAGTARTQHYVGPETPELLERIANHREVREDENGRRALVSALVRSYNLPRPVPEIGEIIAALAKGGAFRLRGVLIGTVAYQTYSAMLGIRLAAASLQTGDVDIAQFKTISIAVADQTPPALDLLKEVDKSFRAVPQIGNDRRATSYAAASGLRVDFLTPNEGRETDEPQALPALQTDARPLRFLDFLIREPEQAVVLHGAGILVQVPTPARYAVHKLIVSRRRGEGSAKRDKDIQQAGALLSALAEKRPHDLDAMWREAWGRGRTWRRLLLEALSEIDPRSRDATLAATQNLRSIVPGLDLTFSNPPARYDFGRDVVTFAGKALNDAVACAISREALDDHFGTNGQDQSGRIKAFLANRSDIELMARTKYLSSPIEEPNSVLIKTDDVPLLARAPAKTRD